MMECCEQIVADVLVIGAGPAGLAAGVGACRAGVRNVLVLERADFPGGVLPQCVHDGFGLHLLERNLTGPEYAGAWERLAKDAGVRIVCGCTVLSVERGEGGFLVWAIGAAVGGRVRIDARAVVLATGCRERTRGQLGIPGTRPAGVMTAGTAQYMMNIGNQLPGDKAVVMGLGDIGLIMARRLTLEGAQVRMVLGAQATGLLRNYVRCIQDFDIPLRLGWGVASIHGQGRLKGVMVAPFLENGDLDLSRKEYIRCNLLLLACGLVPEREAIAGLEAGQGLFICGNAERPFDLVDRVTQEGLRAGIAAARWVNGCATADDRTTRLLDIKVKEPKGTMADFAPVGAGAADAGFAGAGGDARLVPCTVCPTGCIVQVDGAGNASGFGCERGRGFALEEVERPQRIFTGTVKVGCGNGAFRLVPVRSDRPIARDALIPVAALTRRVRPEAPVASGDVLARDIDGAGANLVATGEAAVL